jgi:hypothetical protein
VRTTLKQLEQPTVGDRAPEAMGVAESLVLVVPKMLELAGGIRRNLSKHVFKKYRNAKLDIMC